MADWSDAEGPKKKAPAPARKRWFREETDAGKANSITSELEQLRANQQQRVTQYIVSTRLYGNLPALPFGGMRMARLNDNVTKAIKDRITYALVPSVIDTLVSKIAKNKPRPLFLTSGGDYRQQRKAKGLTKFVDGVFYENEADQAMPAAMRDACVYGDGLVHVYDDHGRVGWERALSVEMYVDEIEGYYGRPRSLHRVKEVDRGVLADAFPEHKSEIMDAPGSFMGMDTSLTSDLVQVRESWHLPSGPDAKDGRHLISIDGCVLTPEDEQGWEHDWFPFAKLPYTPRLYGFWAQGLAEQLQPIQIEINKLLWTISRSMHLAGSFKILTENGSKIVKEHLNNDLGTVVSYTGTPPSYVVPPIVPPEVYAHFETLCRKGYEQAGISMMSAVSTKPAGLDSGKALREFNDIESDRFTTTGQNYERFALDLTRLSIETVKQITKGGKKYRVSTPARGRTVDVQWSEVRLDESDYVMKCFPVSALPQDPAGRLQTVQEYAQAGYLTPTTARRLLAFPDLEADDSLATAMEDHLTDAVERMVYEGEAYQPEPFDDLAMARELAQEAYARGQTNGTPEENLELLRVFMGRIDALLTPPAAPMAALPAGPDVAPQAVPEAPPQSDLLPTMPAPTGAPQ